MAHPHRPPADPAPLEYQLTPAGTRLEVVLVTVAAWVEHGLPRTGSFRVGIGNEDQVLILRILAG
ncbi:hypothetical protein [Streptomyces sp. NBC_01235]|uniref:hypothetical protein n=1 Tax=Streptomyces sp. NBC_01235 TaxID=2903788 RepID=UPI003FA39529